MIDEYQDGSSQWQQILSGEEGIYASECTTHLNNHTRQSDSWSSSLLN